MDSLTINNQSFHILSIILVIITYLSAFKNGKPTCQRYLLNSFLYLMVLFSLYFSSLKIQKDYNIDFQQSFGVSIITFILLLGLLYLLYTTNNVVLKHLLAISIIFILAFVSKKLYEKYDREYIEDVIKKCMMITLLCGISAIIFGKYLTPQIEMILLFTFIITLLFYIIDSFFFKSKNREMVNYIFLFIFSGFIMFDTNRVISLSKTCKEGNADYITNMLDMFVNLINVFQVVAELGE